MSELTGAGHAAFAFRCDVRDRAAAQVLARQAADSMGGLDVLVSNAGVEPLRASRRPLTGGGGRRYRSAKPPPAAARCP